MVPMLIKKIRSWLMLRLRPNSRYFLATRSLRPLSVRFGFDRGTPIDRYWIESFLNSHKNYIRGKCLEVTDNYYTKKFGGKRVTKSDILDINSRNKKANVHADLRHLSTLADNTYDCILLTHVLGLIDDVGAAVSECHRILKPGGALIATSSCFSPVGENPPNYWRFTTFGFRHLFDRYFPHQKLITKSYGNVFSGQCFWVGMAQEELSTRELKYNDSRYQCIVGAVVVKK